jgi:hypothetical protein
MVGRWYARTIPGGDWVALSPPSVIRQFTRYSWDSRTNDAAFRRHEKTVAAARAFL